MRDPKRILEKILGDGKNLDQLEETGEPLDLLNKILRDVVRCRRTQQWISDNYGIDVVVSAATFSAPSVSAVSPDCVIPTTSWVLSRIGFR